MHMTGVAEFVRAAAGILAAVAVAAVMRSSALHALGCAAAVTAAGLAWSMNCTPTVSAFLFEMAGKAVILLDSGASEHLTGLSELLTDIVTIVPRRVQGAAGASFTCKKGLFGLLGVNMHIMRGAPSLLSQSKLLQLWNLQPLGRRMYEVGTRNGDGAKSDAAVIVFAQTKGVYPLAYAEDAEGSVIYCHDGVVAEHGGLKTLRERINRLRAISVLSATTSTTERKSRRGENQQRAAAEVRARELRVDKPHTPGEVRAALMARQLQRTFLCSSTRLIATLPHLIGTTVVADDVRRADLIFGLNSDGMMAHPNKLNAVPRESKMGRTVPRGTLNQSATVDILFLWGVAFVMFRLKELCLTMPIGAKDKSERPFTEALIECTNCVQAAGFRLDAITVDGEKAAASAGCIAALAGRGVKVLSQTRNDHVVEIERDNRSTRSMLIQLFLGLRYRHPLSWLRLANTYCQAQKAFVPQRGRRADEPTPAERYHGRKFNDKEFTLKYGDFCLSLVPGDNKSDKGLCRDEVVFLGRDWNRANAAWIYIFKTRAITTRTYSGLSLQHLPDYAIGVINEIADREMRIAGMRETEMQFDDKMQTEDRMTISDRQEEIMTSNLAAFYGDRAAARALVRRTDPRGSGIPDPRPADDDADDGPADDEEADFGPFTTDSLRSSATRSYIVRRLSAATEGPGGSFVRDVEQAARRPVTAAATWEDFEHVTIDKRGNDAILRESEYEQSKGTFTWSSDDWHVEPDEEAELRESRSPHDNFKDLMAFFAVSRKKNRQVVSAFNISVKEAFDLFPNEAYTSTHDELSKVLHRTFEPHDFKRLTKMQKKSGIPCMLFLRTKMHPMTNDFLKLKARLVACELRARASAKDIENASSPTVSMTSFLVFLTICAKRGWQLGTADCPNAYLNAEVNPDLEPKFAVFDKTTTRIALEIRPELQALLDHKGRLWGRLRFSLYGLLQSGKNWYMHISATLRSLGLEASDCDPCVWFGTFQGQELILLLYVDDVIVGTELTSTIRALFEALDKTYKGIIDTANYDDVLTYLGMSIDNRENDTIYVHQPAFTEQLLKDVNNGMFGNIKEKKSPAPADALSLDDDAPALTQAGSAYYRSTLMRIAYLVNCTRPDLKVALMALSRRMHCATTQDASRLMHLVGYISVTRTYGLTIKPGEGDLTVFGYTDASHATMHDMRSVTGGAICVGTGGATVFSKTSKQTIVAKSSMEAEYIACSDVTSQIIHVRNLLISLGIPQPPAIVYVDNNSAIAVVKKGRPTAMLTRHIAVKAAWVTERHTITKEIKIVYCPTQSQLADCMTKQLFGRILQRMTAWILGWAPHPGPSATTADDRD